MNDVIALILAGGRGERLGPLTRHRTKPAVPIGGSFRIIDFTLSNCINSGIRRILVLTQYKAASLERHIDRGWHFLSPELGDFITVRPPEQRVNEKWYQGTADAVYQNIYTIENVGPKNVLILSGDHIYRMDYRKLLDEHVGSGADATIACQAVPIQEAERFGVLATDRTGRIVEFEEKPESPKTMPDDPTQCLASMGIYVFRTEFLFQQLCDDAIEPGSVRDFGRNVIPSIINSSLVRAHEFRDARTGEPGYWRDVGTLDSYYEANMDLISIKPELNLYDPEWPIRTYQPPLPPPKFVFNDRNSDPPRVGYAVDSMVSSGTIVSGGRVAHSVVSSRVRVDSFSEVTDSIIFDNVCIGEGAKIRRAILDKGVCVPAGMRIGYDVEEDRRRRLFVTDSGIVAVGKHDRLE